VVNQVSVLNAITNSSIFLVLFLFLDDLPNPDYLMPVLYIALGVLSLNSLFWVVSYVRKIKIKPSYKLKFSTIRKVFEISLVGYLANLLNMLNYRLDIWILEDLRSTTQVGLYALAVNFAQMLWNVSEPIASVLVPYLNNPKEQNKWRKFTFLSRLNFTLVFGIGIFACLLSGLILPLVYGEEFRISVTVPVVITRHSAQLWE